MLMVPTRLGRSMTCDERCLGVSNEMIVGVGKCAFGSCTMRHEHRDRQNCDCTRKLLPDRHNSRPGD